jgi:hypothetical protein
VYRRKSTVTITPDGKTATVKIETVVAPPK